ncbi:MlaD family protein [Conexibacter sp. DBS9H8]|uniref:MlaD family protein n=1 Tax=Conexibacter sp. DBS9H8 TaxID=2937801 RepID=UPI00200FEA57|nr:MlaD family protein [Conexibacter sp. DBS9H8]
MSARRTPARRGSERRYLALAVLAALGLSVLAYAAFVRQLPFKSQFELRAVFASSNDLEPGNPVREAGLDIGNVTGVGPGPHDTSVVTMQIDRPASLRLHADASLAIEPRLIFEGNFYVRVNPGTPAAPPLRSGATIPIARTTIPVQIDQALDVFTAPTRDALRGTVAQLAQSLDGPPGHSGADGLRRAVRALDRALGPLTQVANAALGTSPGDLHRAVGSSSDVAFQLAHDPSALAGAVTHFNDVAGALASQDQALAQSVRGLDGVLQLAPSTLTALDRALPVLTRFSRVASPALRAAPAPLRSTAMLLGQIDALVQPGELPRLLDRLAPVTSTLPVLERRLGGVFALLTPAARCVSRNVVPALDMEVPDGRLSTGRPAWQDLLHMAAGLSGVSPGFDANGGTLRIGLTESAQALEGFIPGIGKVVGLGAIQGVDPTWLGYGVIPPFRPDAPCVEQALPNLAARASLGPPAGMHAITLPQPSARQRAQLASILTLLSDGPAGRARLLQMLLSPTGRAANAPQRSGAIGPSVPIPSPPARPAPPAGTGAPAAAGPPARGGSLASTVGALLGKAPTTGQGRSTPGNAIQSLLSALGLGHGGGQ